MPSISRQPSSTVATRVTGADPVSRKAAPNVALARRGPGGDGLRDVSPGFPAGFIWDDEENVVTNGTLRTLDGLRQMWLVPQSIQQYYPLMYTAIGSSTPVGVAPLGYHLVNVAATRHGGAIGVAPAGALQVPGAWPAAALFAVHPVIVESVAWVTERKNVLSLSLAL